MPEGYRGHVRRTLMVARRQLLYDSMSQVTGPGFGGRSDSEAGRIRGGLFVFSLDK